eukprot:TRINITY_DN80401_c0_g1_i1.p2 TRINITY_DN80401_c0_g1~~TRINITY_DN80401_c0_g1_i1.p2  ORF type:complete len:220 (-),score=18.15 TRINITY_DN80401_c0_g1_i1:1189-1800(-)
MSNIPTEQQAANQLEAFYNEISFCINSGIDDYIKYDSQRAAIHTNRTKANLIRDYVVHYARLSFQERTDAKIIEKGGLFVILINDKFAIRFKKLNKDKLSSNIPTRQATRFSTNQLILSFPDFQHNITNLDAGYISDTNYTFYDGVRDAYLVCRNGNNLYWSLKLDSADSIVTLPLIEFVETTTDNTSIVKVKPAAKKKAVNE